MPGSKRIFIVEDEGIVVADLADRLRRLGYAVAGTAGTGESALEKIASSHPHLVLMDIFLQGQMDGVQVAQIVNDRFDIPVVFLTAHADDVTAHRAEATGPFGYILKPFDERELNVAIEIGLYRHLAEKKLRDLNLQLQESLAHIKTLHGLLPICAWCNKIRDDNGQWEKLETYIKSHSEADFTHGICPECLAKKKSELAQ
jgi:two-component system, response regulator PdtaR